MLIRKIAVGSDYKNAMNYLVGQSVLGNNYTINDITQDSDGSVSIWIRNQEKGEILRWKRFNANVPISFEFNIDF
jgi:hypothetical protein